ncbi:unnamed protein product [Cylindrotheca closterium]|uniref:Uncharacterized protein n=1 Tax=Cylindrotheca closterium TaxID=2856 RepID=A0AAD2FS64_9STRA|nr:unnamed protein product [Cylindrotheca closterium]
MCVYVCAFLSHSNKGDIVKDLIEKLFGKQGAVKNYHMSMKNRLRRCKGVSETVGCSQGHPYVPVQPEQQTQNFQSNVIFVLRNFMTAFPAEHTDKGFAYHGNKGQAPEDGWRDVRDKYIESSMKAWKDVLQWWNTADYYKIATYVPYEKLLNPGTGPAIVQKLADTLAESGFEVAPREDIPCIWYQVISKEIARQKALQVYTPGFTPDQRKFLLTELNSLIQSYSNLPSGTTKQEELVSILEGYRDEVQFKMRIDKPSANK